MSKCSPCYSAALLLASHPLGFSHIPLPSPRLEECSSEVPLLPTEVMVFLGGLLRQSAEHLSEAADPASIPPHPLLLIKFFIIICRWGPSPLCVCLVVVLFILTTSVVLSSGNEETR